MPDVEEAAAGGRLTIDLAAMAGNWTQLRQRAAPAECAAVVKADGYGLGIDRVVPALARAGCRTFFVAVPSEGVRVRQAAPSAKVYVLNGVFAKALDLYREHELRPVIGSTLDAERLADAGLPCALHVDTGMTRLGLRVGGGGASRRFPLAPASRPAPRHDAFRLRRRSRPSDDGAPARAVRSGRPAIPRHPPLGLELGGDARPAGRDGRRPPRHRDLRRRGAERRRAARPRRHAGRSRRAGARGEAGRDRRLRRGGDADPRQPHRRRLGGLRGRLSARRPPVRACRCAS